MKIFSILIILVGLLSACNNSEESKEHLVQPYRVALDTILAEGGTYQDLAFIAIDMSNFEDLDKSHKKEIVSYFKKKYKLDVMEATFEQLKQKGLYDFDKMALVDGLLLSIRNVDFKSDEEMVFQGTSYRASEGSMTIEFTVLYIEEKWEVQDVRLISIS